MPNAVFSCPKCGQVLAELPPTGLLTAVCAVCRLKYQVVRGRVMGATSMDVVRANTLQLSRSDIRSYQIQLALATGRHEEIEFRCAANENVRLPRPGDIVSAIYLMRNERREQLLSVHDATTGGRVLVASPGEQASKWGWLTGAGAGLMAFLFIIGAEGSASAALAGAVAVMGSVGFFLGYRFMPRVDLSADDAARLSVEQRMRAQKLELDEARAETRRHMDERRTLRGRLLSLRDRMERMQLDAGVAAIAMDGIDAPHIVATLGEMRELEEQQRELQRQIAANAEVDSLLHGRESSVSHT